MLKKVALVVLMVVAAYTLLCLILPGSFTVKSEVSIRTAQEDAFAVVASFRNWQHWSPWAAKDSTIQTTLTGPETHVGSGMQWTSKHSVSGSMQVVDFKPYESIVHDLTLHDVNATWKSSFRFIAAGENTTVIWEQFGPLFFFQRPMGLLYPRFIQPDLDHGLQNMKRYLEARVR